MGILKDWREDNEGYVFKTKAVNLFSPKVWFRLHKWRQQRANRGWSDRDAWGAGEHIAKMTADMLQHLKDEGMCDWPQWFKMNVREPRGYKNLQSVIDDINNYLDFTLTSWADDLDHETNFLDDEKEFTQLKTAWYKDGKKLTKRQLDSRIKKFAKEEAKLYERATKAMEFFGRNFASFWD